MVKVGSNHDVLFAKLGIASIDNGAHVVSDAVTGREELVVRLRAIAYRRARAMECRAEMQCSIPAGDVSGGGVISGRAGLATAEGGAGEDSDIGERPRHWRRCGCRLTCSGEDDSAQN